MGHLLTSDSLQFGFKAKTNTMQCTWLVTEVVHHFLRQGSHSIVTLLECKAAFETCKFNILSKKRVLDNGVPTIVARALMFSYQQQYAWVRWGNKRSDIFTIKYGTRQGSIASPVLWSVSSSSWSAEVDMKTTALERGRQLQPQRTGGRTWGVI